MIIRILVAISVVVVVASADELETKTDFQSLPPAVRQAAKEQSKGARYAAIPNKTRVEKPTTKWSCRKPERQKMSYSTVLATL
jgi:hypothetical protein